MITLDGITEEEYNAMQDWQKRVVDETRELGARLDKLNKYLVSESFASASNRQQVLLRKQHGAMTDYLLFLTLRIEEFL